LASDEAEQNPQKKKKEMRKKPQHSWEKLPSCDGAWGEQQPEQEKND